MITWGACIFSLVLLFLYLCWKYYQPLSVKDQYRIINGRKYLNFLLYHHDDNCCIDGKDLILQINDVQYRVVQNTFTFDVKMVNHDCIIVQKITYESGQRRRLKNLKKIFADRHWHDNIHLN